MDLQRNVLLIALLVVSYLLFLNWQQDYNKPAAAMTQPVAGDTAGLAPAPTAPPATPAAGDVPPPPPPAADAASPAGPASAVASGERVHVRTDVLDVTIDLNGGDVVEVTLPHYPFSLDQPDRKVRLMSTGTPTYLAQSSLVVTQGAAVDDAAARAVYTADAREYRLADDQDALEVVLRLAERDGVTIEKVYRFRRNDYLMDVTWRVRNNGATPWAGYVWGQFQRDGSADPSHEGKGFFGGAGTFLGGAYFADDEKYNRASLGDVQEKPLSISAQGGWMAFLQHYFIGAWIPDQGVRNSYSTVYQADRGMYLFRFSSPLVSVAPGASGELGAGLYAGPKEQDRLAQLSTGLDLAVDYGALSFIAEPLFWLLVQIHDLVGNWGVAIILLTMLVKLVFFYPSHISYRSMAHMRRITPELMRLREEYKNDRQKQAQEMMALYRREKVNPLGGCLPILIQMPVFIALYWVLVESVALRQAPFMLWIQDLSVMDPYFVLPILMGISMWFQTKLNPAPPDPMQAKMMQWLPWVFTVLFLFFASGLVLYWLVNNVLSIAQQWYITRQVEKQHAKN